MPSFFSSRNASKKTLSERKTRFVKGREHSPYQLVVEDYEPIIEHYITKYQLENIVVVMNGSTEFGENKIAENMEKIQQIIESYEDEDIQYAVMLRKYWVQPTSSMPLPFFLNKVDDKNTDFSPYYDELYQAIKDEFLDEKGRLKALDTEQLKRLNQVCLRLNCCHKLEEYRTQIIANLTEKKEKVCLNKDQAVEEVKKIQANLEEGETVIYFFTNNKRSGPAHFEVIQIKKDGITKPVHWFMHPSNIFTKNDFTKIFIPDVTDFVSPTIKPQYLQPQVDKISCGTLGLLYLKELLKNNNQQLNDFTLSIPLYRTHLRAVEKGNLFFPSPHVLRYSQSSFYNDVILAMVKNTKTTTIKFKGENYKIKPLKVILEESIKFATEKGDLAVAEENKKILSNLPAFRKQWLTEYKKEIENRKAMQGEKYNLYLAYSTKRMQAIANHPEGLQKGDEPNHPESTEKEKNKTSLLERIRKTINRNDKKTSHRSLLFPERAVTAVVENPLYDGDIMIENPLYTPKS